MNDNWKTVFTLTAGDLLDFLEEMLSRSGYVPYRGKKYLYAAGRLPVLLVAHADTAHSGPPKEVFRDREAGVLWSPDGLGADDRAGVLGILEILRSGHRPHVLFTDGEERGGIGAEEAARELSPPPVRFVAELDRRNGGEAVFYGCANAAFVEYVESFGFHKAQGTFSDISIICPRWKIAGVNLSCGYYREHTDAEYLRLRDLKNTIDRVAAMCQRLPETQFEYVSTATAEKGGKYWWNFLEDDWYTDRRLSTRHYIVSGDGLMDELVNELVAFLGGSADFWLDWLEENWSAVTTAVCYLAEDDVQLAQVVEDRGDDGPADGGRKAGC